MGYSNLSNLSKNRNGSNSPQTTRNHSAGGGKSTISRLGALGVFVGVQSSSSDNDNNNIGVVPRTTALPTVAAAVTSNHHAARSPATTSPQNTRKNRPGTAGPGGRGPSEQQASGGGHNDAAVTTASSSSNTPKRPMSARVRGVSSSSRGPSSLSPPPVPLVLGSKLAQALERSFRKAAEQKAARESALASSSQEVENDVTPTTNYQQQQRQAFIATAPSSPPPVRPTGVVRKTNNYVSTGGSSQLSTQVEPTQQQQSALSADVVKTHEEEDAPVDVETTAVTADSPFQPGKIRNNSSSHADNESSSGSGIESSCFLIVSTPPSEIITPARNNNNQQPHAGLSRRLSSVSDLTASCAGTWLARARLTMEGRKSKSEVASMTSTLTPFASKLAMSSFQLTKSEEPVVTQRDVDGTVLFVDLTGYSAAARELEDRGAFALFEAVNGYFSRIVECIVSQFGGEIISFAGDAVIAVWYEAKFLPCAAAHCAMELEKTYGEHPVAGTDLKFRLHMGICHGELNSTVFVCEQSKHMQKHFPMISGVPMQEIGEAVSAAKAGECVISQGVLHRLCTGPGVDVVEMDLPHLEKSAHASLRLFKLKTIELDMTECSHAVQQKENDENSDGATAQDDSLSFQVESEEANLIKFVHPRLAERLRHGLLQSHLAEMRLLTVLFIHKTDPDVKVADWFSEVQSVLDKFRCPIIQVIDDDKGIHLIAAINLFSADREPAVTGIRLAQALVGRETGSTIGMACGRTFCGVVGSSLASRWDIVGPMCVRSCRLMQHGVKVGESVVIGESVIEATSDASLTVKFGEIEMKGSNSPVPVYKIADVDTKVLGAITSATRSCTAVHGAVFLRIQRLTVNNPSRQCCGVIVKGGPDSGKAFLCVRAVHGTGITPCLHVAVPGCHELSVLETVSEWFSHHINTAVRAAAEQLSTSLGKGHTIRSIRLGIELVKLLLKLHLKFALVVRQAQVLDTASMSFLRQAIQQGVPDSQGRFLVFLTIVPQNGAPSAAAVKGILESGAENNAYVMMCELGNLSAIETSALVEHRLGWRCQKDLSKLISQKSGRVAGLVNRVVGYLDKSKLTCVTEKGFTMAIPENLRALLATPWITMCPSACAKVSVLIDSITTTQKTLLKCLGVLHVPYRQCGETLLVDVMSQLVSSTMRQRLAKDLDVLEDLNLLLRHRPESPQNDATNSNYVVFANPAVADVVRSITLPDQCKQIAQMAVNELGFIGMGTDWEPASLEEQFTVAHTLWLAGHQRLSKSNYLRAWGMLKNQSMDALDSSSSKLFTEQTKHPMHSAMLHDLVDLRIDVDSIFPKEEDVDPPDTKSQSGRPMPEIIIRLNDFRPPFSLGGLTLAWRTTAVTLRTLAVDAAIGTATPAAVLIDAQTVVNGYLAFVKIIDKTIGFTCKVDERALLYKWLTRNDAEFCQIVSFAEEFFDYFETILTPRIQMCHNHIEKVKAEPVIPEGKVPFWVGTDRQAMVSALKTTLQDWQASKVLAVRNGLMRMATQGWIPKNPDQTLEFQRDCYLKNQTHPLICFPALMYNNLSLFWDD